MKYILSLFFATLLSVSPGMAQSSVTPIETTSTIYLRAAFLGGSSYIQDGQRKNAGGVMQHLADDLDEVPSTQVLARRGVGHLKRARFFTYMTYGFTIASFLVKNQQQALALTGAGLATGGLGLHFRIRGRNHIQQAVWQYNDAMWRYPNGSTSRLEVPDVSAQQAGER